MPQTVLVTGGAGDIGRALCRRFLRDGLNVAVLDRDAAALGRACIELGGGARVLPVQADVTSLGSLRAAVAAVEATFGGIDVLVNNAGGVACPTLTATGEVDWLADIDLNLNGAWRCVRAVQDGTAA
jgi:NAD(P)-dependent dehydrogenase (short-subunit alcohol dehydrogenase family)